MEIVLGAIGALGVIWAIITFPVRWWWNRRKPPASTKEDIERLEAKVDRLPAYLDGLSESSNRVLRAAFEEGRLLQLEGYQAQSAHKHREAIDRFTRALELAETDSQRSALHILRGNSYQSISDYDSAQADYHKTLKLSEAISPLEEAAEARAVALGNLGNVYSQLNELKKAEEHHQQALEIHRGIRDRLGEAASLGNLGIVYGQRNGPGDLHKAENYLQQALEIQRQIGDRLGEANQLTNLGNVYVLRGGPGDLDKAEEHHQQALQIHREIGNRLGEARDLGNLGVVYFKSGDLGKAEKHHKRSAAMHRKLGSRFNEAQAIFSLGIISLQRGDTGTTREYIEEAQATFQAIGAAAHAEGARWLLEELERRQQERGER